MDAAIAPVPGNVCRTCHTEAPLDLLAWRPHQRAGRLGRKPVGAAGSALRA